MARLRVYKDNDSDSTALSNRFIDEYMKDANDAQLKVYLYLTRMMSAGLSTSVSDLADLFNHTEKDILRALKYWEKKQLLELDYDEFGNLSGIHLMELTPKSSKSLDGRIPVTLAVASKVAPFSRETAEQYEEKPSFAKPYYSVEQLRAAKEDDRTRQLLFVAETYIGKPLSPTEIKTLLFFMDTLHFSDDLIIYLLEYCVERGKKDFKYIEKVAVNWAQNGIRTPQDAQQTTGKYDPNVYAIMNELGKSGSPTPAELEFITRWTTEYGFSADIIFEACKRTVLTTDKNRFDYAEGILSNWRKQHVTKKADIARMDELHQQKKTATRTASANRFNQFPQTNYNLSELEKQLISN